jgi:hypothetical protein
MFEENEEGLEFNSEYQFLAFTSVIKIYLAKYCNVYFFRNRCDLPASSHLRHCCQCVCVQCYFTTPSLLCSVILSCSTLHALFHVCFDTHLHTSHPHSVRLNSGLSHLRLLATVLCTQYLLNGPLLGVSRRGSKQGEVWNVW